MIRTTSSKQLTIAEFDWPFDTALDKHNRWVKLSACIPWDELAESYYQGFTVDRGRPMKDARLVIGAVIIKHKLCLSDVETVQQIQENPYLQFFVGLSGYQTAEPFASSLFVEIRKRMGEAVFEGFHQAIINAHEGKKPVNSEPPTPPTEHQPSIEPDVATRDVATLTSSDETSTPEPTATAQQGQLILDATVVEQAIRLSHRPEFAE
jgi:IS5 family transposase